MADTRVQVGMKKWRGSYARKTGWTVEILLPRGRMSCLTMRGLLKILHLRGRMNYLTIRDQRMLAKIT